MKILGIDPGYAIVGTGIVNCLGNQFELLEAKAITTSAELKFPERLCVISRELTRMLETHRPEVLAIEKLYFNTNTTTAIDVAAARGVILLECAKQHMPVYEYTPLQVKQSVVGYGRAEKQQVQMMVKRLLNLNQVPKPDDVADALAIAICCAHSAASLMRFLK